jgi:hypothetical protein
MRREIRRERTSDYKKMYALGPAFAARKKEGHSMYVAAQFFLFGMKCLRSWVGLGYIKVCFGEGMSVIKPVQSALRKGLFQD